MPRSAQTGLVDVPAPFVRLVTLAILDEIKSDAEWVTTQADELAKQFSGEETDRAVDLTDLSGAGRCLAEDHRLLEQVCDVSRDPRADIRVLASANGIRHMLEQTIRCATKSMEDACGYSPIEAGDIALASQAAVWASEEIERLDETVTA